VPYLNCRECGLSIRSRNPLTERAYCPRCRARGRIEPLVRTPLPLRQLQLHQQCQPADIGRSTP
jgi:hypothetical protein